jgi:hypothetical protein
MADYAAKPTKAKEDGAIIELRKRMLGVFLNRCRKMKEVCEDGVWWRFLDPNVSWVSNLLSHIVLHSLEKFDSNPGTYRARSCIPTLHHQSQRTT